MSSLKRILGLHNTNYPSINSIHTIIFDFDGVFTDNKLWLNENGEEFVCCNRADGLGLDILRSFINKQKLTLDCFILSKEKNLVVNQRAKKLKIKCYQGISNKLEFTMEYLEKRFGENKESINGVIYLGNDLNDLAVMKKVGFSIAPSNSHPAIKKIASAVLNTGGGEGFVRTFIEDFLEVGELDTDTLANII